MSSLTTTDRLKDLLPRLFNEQQLEGDYYLRFQLTNEISALIDLSYVQESLTIDGDRITPVPNLPEYTVGLMNTRNQVFLAVDLAQLIGFPPQTVNLRQYQTIVVQIKSQNPNLETEETNLFGLTVKRILGISRLLPNQFSSQTDGIPDILGPFILKTSLEDDSQTLSTEEIVESSSVNNRSFLLDLNQLITTQIKSSF